MNIFELYIRNNMIHLLVGWKLGLRRTYQILFMSAGLMSQTGHIDLLLPLLHPSLLKFYIQSAFIVFTTHGKKKSFLKAHRGGIFMNKNIYWKTLYKVSIHIPRDNWQTSKCKNHVAFPLSHCDLFSCLEAAVSSGLSRPFHHIKDVQKWYLLVDDLILYI